MSARAEAARPPISTSGLKQAVVLLLLLDFALFAREDWIAAAALSGAGASFLEWTNAFATTFDEAAWFALLFLFELELRHLSRGATRRSFQWLIQSGRALCCIAIAHTVFSNAWDVDTLASNPAAPPGELGLAWVGLVESVAWLLIVFLLFLDERALASGRERGLAIRGVLKLLGYGTLVFAAVYWGAAGHCLYAWDEFLWVGAFGGLELSFRQFRRAAGMAA